MLRFLLMLSIKYLAMLFYTVDVKWMANCRKNARWDQLKLMVLLNHTSLFEPIFLRVAPTSLIWHLANRLVVPGADITVNRPVLGRFFKMLMPGMIPISRQKDHTWQHFLDCITSKSLVAILPEGRMKRRDGLDKYGQPMTIRGGVADVLACQNEGKILFVYSGGLHHIQAPGDKLPRLFKRIRVTLELIDLSEYKRQCGFEKLDNFKQRVIEDMQERLKYKVPQ